MTSRFVALIVLLWPAAALGDPARDIAISVEALRSDDGRVRVGAAERLSTLGRTDLPAIDSRLQTLKKRVIDPEEGYQALRRFAHAAGSSRADDALDIEPGIKARLEMERPTPVEAAIAEELLLLRSLEKLGSADAYRLAVLIFGLHYDIFRWESRHSVARVGMRAMPALLDGAAYGDAGLAEWATQSIESLGKPTPADALRALDGDDRAELLRAYAERRIMDAMESVAAFLDDPDPVVRKAAASALRRYGRNAIWQIRDMARIFLGEDLDRAWTAQQSLEYLVDKLEARRLAPQREALARATELAERGELDEARRLLDLVLAERPKMERRGVAADVYAKLAARATSEDRHADAARFLLKASLITPDADLRESLIQSATTARSVVGRANGEFHPGLVRAASIEDRSAAQAASEQAPPRDHVPVATFAFGLLLLIGIRPFRALWWASQRVGAAGSRSLAARLTEASHRRTRHARKKAARMEPSHPQKAQSQRSAPAAVAPVPARAPTAANLPVEFVFGKARPKRHGGR